MKIALVHDYIKEYGGAERVLETLHEMYPDAPVYTLVYCPEFLGPHRERFKNWTIKTSPLQYIPFKHKFISIFRLLAPFLFPLFNFSGYDVMIVSATGAYSPNCIRTKYRSKTLTPTLSQKEREIKDALHVCYMHTPPRYLYGYATAREWKKNPFVRVVAELMNYFLRKVDIASSKNVDQYVANSQTVADRIRKFYKRDSVVVYPPVLTEVSSSKYQVLSKKTQNTKYKILNTKYYLAGGRLARPKHFELIIQACAALNVQLKIFGRGFAGYEENLKSQIANLKTTSQSSNIELVGEVTDKEKLELMRGAKAFLMASEDEDFGIVPVEAMGVGTPVIAYHSGGLKETVVDGKTGIFFNELTTESLREAIKRFEKIKIKPEDCIAQAQKFSKENFEKGIQAVISSETK